MVPRGSRRLPLRSNGQNVIRLLLPGSLRIEHAVPPPRERVYTRKVVCEPVEPGFRTKQYPFPFNLLTLVVSLEAIVLIGFVLMSQNRLTQVADRRAHLDLQVNLLAEQELTAILKVVCLIAEKTGVTVKGDPDLIKLLARTDVKVLAEELTREMATVDAPPPSNAVSDERTAAQCAACG